MTLLSLWPGNIHMLEYYIVDDDKTSKYYIPDDDKTIEMTITHTPLFYKHRKPTSPAEAS